MKMSNLWLTGGMGRWTVVILCLLLVTVQAQEAVPNLQKPELAPGVDATPPTVLKVVLEPAAAAPVAEAKAKTRKPLEPVKYSPLQIAIWNPAQLIPEAADVYGLRLDLGYGRNTDVYGIDLGVYNNCSGNLRGLQLGLVWNEVESAGHPGILGLQLGGIYKSALNVTGVQGVGIVAKADTIEGLQLLHIVNLAEGNVTGIQGCAAYNQAQEVTGIQSGIFNQAKAITGWQNSVLASLTEIKVSGWQDSAIWSRAHQVDGVQMGGIWAKTEKTLTGWQCGLVTMADRVYGVQSGGWNMTGYICGLQLGVVNISPSGLTGREGVKGVQFGLIFNTAPEVVGVQVGLFNFTRVLTGVQIGLCNIVSDTSQYIPLINANF